MSKNSSNAGFGVERKHLHLFKETLEPKRISEEIIKNHFSLLRTQAENALSLSSIQSLEKFAHYSYSHFSSLIPKQAGEERRRILSSEYKETLEGISEKSDELRTLSKEKGVQVKGEVSGFGAGIGVGSKETKAPPE